MIKKTAPQKPATQRAGQLGIALAMLLAGMALLQLANFEAFTRSISEYHFFGPTLSIIFAVKLIILEIAAIPFLAQLWMSPLARACSAIASLLAPATWFVVQSVGFGLQKDLPNSGLFGGFVPVPVGIFSVLVSVLLVSVAVWLFDRLGGRQALAVAAKKSTR